MERYNEYKDSGVKWLGEIPKHWEVIPLKHLVTYNDEVLLESEKKDKHIKYVEIGDVDYISGIKKHTEYLFQNAPSRARRITRKGDVIVSTVRTYLRAVASIDTNDLIVSTGFAVLRAKKMSKKYLAYYILSDTFIDEVIRRSVGTSYPAINANELVSINLIYPSLIEQESIANYLDTTTSKIDEAIAQQQKMIDLLNERKQIIINNAVTKGLDPNVKMKSSGIDWIGEIPDHWEVRKIKSFGTIKSGDGIKNSELSEEGKYPVWGGNGLMGYTDKYNKYKDAIVIGRVGALCGNVRYLSTPTFVTDNALIFDITERVNHLFLLYTMQAANLNALNTSNAQPLITGTKVKNVVIPFPTIEEQTRIIAFLEKQCLIIDEAIVNYQNQITLLQERKQIIINEIVTGKVKVL